MISFFIPVVPVTKKNHSRILTNKASGKPFVMPSEAYKQFESDCAVFIPSDLRHAKISQSVTVAAVFYTKTRRQVDLTNLLSAICDVLVSCGVLADDNRDVIASHDGSRVFYRPEEPGVHITISKYNEPYEQWRVIK